MAASTAHINAQCPLPDFKKHKTKLAIHGNRAAIFTTSFGEV